MKLVGKEKREFTNHIRAFTGYLLQNGRKHTSICNATGYTNGNKIRNRTFGYVVSVRIRDAYINNYNQWLKENSETTNSIHD